MSEVRQASSRGTVFSVTMPNRPNRKTSTGPRHGSLRGPLALDDAVIMGLSYYLPILHFTDLVVVFEFVLCCDDYYHLILILNLEL